MRSVIIAGSLALILTLAVNFVQKDGRVFNSEPYASKLTKSAELYSNYFRTAVREDRSSTLVGKAPAGTPVKVMEEYNHWFKISLPSGNMGWIDEDNLAFSPGALTKHYHNALCALYDKPDTRNGKLLKKINSREWLIRLEHKTIKTPRSTNSVDYSKVKAADGTTGWIKEYHLERVGWEQPRLIKRRDWHFDKNAFISHWKGKSIEDFIAKFSEPSGIKNDKATKTYFFNNIILFDAEHKETGIQATAKDGIIEDFNRTGRTVKWIGYFPLSDVLRSSFVMNGLWGIFDLTSHKSYDKYGDELSKELFNLPKWASIILLILFMIAFLALFYLIMYVPYFVAHKIAYHYSLNRSLANKIILTIAAICSLVLGYLYFVFTNVNIGVFNNWFLLHFLFAVGMTIGFISKWRSDLLYVRCAKCRFWSGTDNGSDLVSRTDKTLTTTYADGHKTRDKGVEEVWIDHRLCANEECGFAWDIRRTWFSGWSRG